MNQTALIISTTPISAGSEEGDELDASLEVELRELEALPSQHGQRLDRVLTALNPEFSRNYLQQLLMAGAVQWNGHAVSKAAMRVKAGDRGSIELRPTPQSQAFKPEPMALDVVFEDEHLLVINKPAGLVVHPAPGHWSATLLNGLLAHSAQAALVPRAGIVHRLDKDTSGLMVVAKTRAVMDSLVQLIAAREVTRQYVALAHGHWAGPAQREVDKPIGRDPSNRLRMAVVDLQKNAGKTARTSFELLVNQAQHCLVLCTLHTGRTHQIRVHMASIQHPLLGDKVYGGQTTEGMQRQALHALRLSFQHPVTGKHLRFTAAPPADFQVALASLSLSYNAHGDNSGGP